LPNSQFDLIRLNPTIKLELAKKTKGAACAAPPKLSASVVRSP
jgi:hypothetical protein